MTTKNYKISIIAGILVSSLLLTCNKNTLKPVAPVMSATAGGKALNQVITCAYTVQPTDWMVDGSTIPPGSTVCIPAGQRGALLLKNFKGTAEAPIVIINSGGKVTFTASLNASYGFKTSNCQYFKILGNGYPAIKYGFEVNGGNIGMTMDDLSSDFEIGYIEVHNSGFAGIMAKTDPSCDPVTWRGNFTMKNVSFYDNYVHNTGGEGFYVGNSFYADGMQLACGTVLPHDVVNVKLYDNITNATGCEGIQVGSAISQCEIRNNTVKNPGQKPFANGQDNGIQIGEGTGGKCFNNLVTNAPGNGIIVLGLGDNLVFNNIILNSKAYGIFADSRYTPGPNFQFINNTIVASVLGGIKLDSEDIPMNTVINNVIIQPSSGQAIITMSSNVKLTASNNYVNKNVNTCQFVNYSKSDFHLQPSSPLIDLGANVLSYGVNFDYYGMVRPSSGGGFDIGATEY